MPYKMEYSKTRIPEEFDRRVKLLSSDKDEIREKYAKGIYTQAQLAELYDVSIGTIKNTLNNSTVRRRNTNVYDKNKRRANLKNHREHKKRLEKMGVLIQTQNDNI